MASRRPRLVPAVLTAVVAASSLVVRPVAADCNDPFGKPNDLLEFHLRMKSADWTALLASRVRSTDGNSAACNDRYPEFQAEFRCGGEGQGPWLKIAVRKKRGEERGAEAPLKPPLKLDLNEDFMGRVPEAKGQRWPAALGDLGYRKLTLNNGQGNKPPGRTLVLPILLSEHVALRLLRREVPSTPGTAFAKITLHTEDQPAGRHVGVYVLIEDIDRGAVRRRWGAAEGRLLKASKAGCPPTVEYDDGAPNQSRAAYDAWITKNPGSYAGTWVQEASRGLDLDTVLRQEAIREILVNGDDTLFFAGGEGNNWLAFDPRAGGLRQYMPWDVDLTFGQQNQNCAPTSLKCPPTVPLLTWCGRNMSRLGRATACNPEIQKRYLQVMCQLTQGSLSSAEILRVWDEADATVRPAVPLEKDVVWGGMDPLSPAIDKSYGAEYLRLKQWIPARIRSVQQQITMRGIPCGPGCAAGAAEACIHLGCPGERRCDGGLWTTCRPLPGCARAPAALDGGIAAGDAAAPPPAQADARAGGPPNPTPPADGRPRTPEASAPPPGSGMPGPGPLDAGAGSPTGNPGPPGHPTGGCQCGLAASGDERDAAGWVGVPLLLAFLVLRAKARRGRRAPPV